MTAKIPATLRHCRKCCLECIAETPKTELQAQLTTVRTSRASFKIQMLNHEFGGAFQQSDAR